MNSCDVIVWGNLVSETIRSAVRGFVCWLFGECWRVSAEREENDALRERVAVLERRVRAEKDSNGWRAGDIFRVR